MRNFTLMLAAPALLAALVACPGPPGGETTAPQAAVAEPIVNMPLTTASEEARARYMEGLQASDMGRFEDAQAALDAALAADPGFAMAHLVRAFNASSPEDFKHHLKAAGETAAGASESERLFIESVQRGDANDLQGMLELSQQLVELEPDSPRAWLQLAFAQSQMGDQEAARATYATVAETFPGFVPAYAALGNSYLFNEPRDFDKAEQYMQKVVELAPGEQGSYDLLGDAHRAKNRLAEARDAYTRAAELDPDSGSPLQQRGHVNSFLGDWDQARADYDAAAALSDPQIAAGYGTWRALVSVHQGDPAAAIAEFEELIGRADEMGLAAPLSAKIDYLDNIGAIARHHGLFEQAESALERNRTLRMERAAALGGESNQRDAEAALVYQEGLLAARKGDYDQAMTKAEEYMAVVEPNADPERNEPAHEMLGLAHLLKGDYQKAVEHYEQADPDDVYARYHLGLAYEGAGQSDKAQAIFQDVAQHNFNFVGYALVRKDAIAKAG